TRPARLDRFGPLAPGHHPTGSIRVRHEPPQTPADRDVLAGAAVAARVPELSADGAIALRDAHGAVRPRLSWPLPAADQARARVDHCTDSSGAERARHADCLRHL